VLRTLALDAVPMPAGQRPLATPNDIRAFWWPSNGSRTKILTFHRVIDEIAGDADLAWVRGRGARVHRSDCPFAPAAV